LIDRPLPRLSNSIGFMVLFALGAMLAGSAELPLGGWIQIPILSLIWWQIRKCSSSSFKTTFLLGLSFGLGYFVLGLWWIFISLHDIGGMNATLSCTAVFLLAGLLAIFFACATLALNASKGKFFPGLLLAASWVLTEYFRGILFTGFPWMGLGEAQVNGPFAPFAPYLGGLGCTFFVVLFSWQLLSLRSHLKTTAFFFGVRDWTKPTPGCLVFYQATGEAAYSRAHSGKFCSKLSF